jgi:CHAT domain-containing protein/Tfp pilus assembly protein PilF
VQGFLVAVLVIGPPGCQPTKKESPPGRNLNSPSVPLASVPGLLAEGERRLAAGENQLSWEVYQRALSQAEKAGDRAGTIASLIGLGDADPPQTDGKPALAALERALALTRGPQADSVRAHLELRRGLHAKRRRDYPQAEKHYVQALAAARRGGDRKMEAQALNALGTAHLHMDRLQQAGDDYRAAISVARSLEYRPVLTLAERGLGNVEGFNGHPDEAVRHFQVSLAFARACSNRNLTGAVLNSIGSSYLDRAEYGKAFVYCQEALRSFKDDKAEMAYTLNNLGIITGQDNADLGIAYFQRALHLAEEIGDDYARTRVINNLGTACQDGGRYDESEKYFLLALHLAEKAGDQQAVSGDWYNLATNYEERGLFHRADRAYRKSLAVARSVGVKSLVAQALGGMADLKRAQKDFAPAVRLADRAAAVALESGGQDTFLRARACAGLALQALGRPREAERAFDEAIATVEAVRSGAAGGELGVLGSRLAPYQGRIELAAGQGHAAEALEAAERTKGRILLETLQTGPRGLASPLAPEERATEERLRDRLSALNTRVLRAGGSQPAVLADRDQARRDLETFTLNLYAARSDLRLRRADLPAWRLADAQALLIDRGTALLEYAVLDDRTYLWVLTADAGSSLPQVRMHRLPVGGKELARQVEAFRRQLAARDLDFQGSARRLYDLLLAAAAPKLRDQRSLCIVPDGALWDLPFQALQPGASEVLLERYALSYAPSLGFLTELAKRKANRPRRPVPREAPTLLAVGDPELNVQTVALTAPLRGGAELARLPEAEREVRTVARLYGSGRSIVYTAAQASEDRVKAEAGKFRVLHFATHALLDDHNPLYSSLVLSPGGPPKREDGLLEAWEILQLHLDADLVVLSACQTARGQPRAGEGMIGLTWALAAAGSAATLASQWEVDSASTADLMVEFHRAWLAGATKAEALRQAALAVRRQERYRHPFYWAPFVLVGDGT